MQQSIFPVFLPILLFIACVIGLAIILFALGNFFGPSRSNPVKRMPYESGMDPIHDTRRRFDVRFHLLAIAFLVFDVELLFLYPWAVTARPAKQAVSAPVDPAGADPAETTLLASETPEPFDEAAARYPAIATTRDALQGTELLANRGMLFPGVMVFIALLTLGFIYDWRKGIFRWR